MERSKFLAFPAATGTSIMLKPYRSFDRDGMEKIKVLLIWQKYKGDWNLPARQPLKVQ